MPVSEDGVPYGSIDVSKLDEVEAKTDEAKAAVDALKRELQQGQEQVAADSQRQNEGAVAGNPFVDEAPKDTRDAQGKSGGVDAVDDKSQSQAHKAPAKKE